jgi:hypothetical protein
VREIEGWGLYLERESESVYETEFEKERGREGGQREALCTRRRRRWWWGLVERTIRNGEMEGEEGEGERGKEGKRDLERAAIEI